MDKLRRVGLALVSAFNIVTPARIVLSIGVAALIVVHGFAPHTFTIDGVTLSLLGILAILILVPILESATLPGGAGVKMIHPEVQTLSEQTEQATNQPEARTQEKAPNAAVGGVMGDVTEAAQVEDEVESVVDEVLKQAALSPRVALMLLSAELEGTVRRLLLATGWATPRAARTLREGVRRLVEVGALSEGVASALTLFSDVRNQIVHGQVGVSEADLLTAVDAGLTLYRSVGVIPREKHIVEAVDLLLYADPGASIRLEGVAGLLLRHTSPNGLTTRRSIFPTTKSGYVVGSQVTWEWGDRQWGESWYRDPTSGDIEQAWLGSLEFRGRRLDEV